MASEDQVETHYATGDSLADDIAARFLQAGKQLSQLTPRDLAPVDEFHIRGRAATIELAEALDIRPGERVLDIGSGLGGPARTLAELKGCKVVGLDLTRAFCDAATAISRWVGQQDEVEFVHGDATALPFDDHAFDAAMTIHAAMNIADKSAVYAHVRRILKPNRIFAAYDVLQGEGGDVVYPVPWARDPSISHLATPSEMRELLQASGFTIVEERDSTPESEAWFRQRAVELAASGPPPVGFQVFLGDEFRRMVDNQVRNLTERRIRTVMFVCRNPA
jgi:ubiquinone/menaquinone biosynthesis C-methylase UbiE